jgi:hypothetical protein
MSVDQQSRTGFLNRWCERLGALDDAALVARRKPQQHRCDICSSEQRRKLGHKRAASATTGVAR